MKRKKSKSKSIYKKIGKKYYIPAVVLILVGIFYLTPIRGAVAHKLAVQGKYYFNGGAYDLDKAVKWYKRAAFVDDKLWVAHYQLARIYFVKDDFKTALKEIDKALAVDPKNKRAYYVRGLIDGYAKNYKASVDDFQKYVDYYQKEWAGYNDLAWAYYQDKEYQKAVDTALKGLEAAPDNPWLLNGLGVSYGAMGEKEKGKAALDKVAALAKDMKADDWKKAYPGNNPETAEWDLAQFRVDVSANLNLASNEFSSGQGEFTAACGGSMGATGVCNGTSCNWGYQCDLGDDPYGHLHSWGGMLCSSGCGWDGQCQVCGDGTCYGGAEDCNNCSADCACAPPPPPPPPPTPVNGVCNSIYDGQEICSLPGTGLCSAGVQSTPSGSGPWDWTCSGTNGSTVVDDCSATKKIVNALCGASNTGFFCSDTQITAKCKSDDSPDDDWYITGTDPGLSGSIWSWSCSSSCNGSPSGACTATMKPKYKGACGSLDGKNICGSADPNTLPNACASGTVFITHTSTGPFDDWIWKCLGSCDTPSSDCSAKAKGSCGWIETNP